MRARGCASPRVRLAPWVIVALCGACENPPPPRVEHFEDEELAAEVLEEEEPREPSEPPPAVAENNFEARSRDVRDRQPPPVVPAAHGDDEFDGEEPVPARRYVYRVRMVVPGGLGESDVTMIPPAAELFVDVAHQRLRARFAGRGWPVPAGSEVRLRRDRPGVYVFDGEGGRPLEPGMLAAWFEGGRVTRRGPPLRVFTHWGFTRRQPEPDDVSAPGELMCAFLAELAGEPRENVMRRCERGAPHLWRMGFWRAEQTAGVPLELPRNSMRADERDGPRPIESSASRAYLEPEALARLRGRAASGEPVEGAPPEGLRVINDSATRAIVAIGGVLAGWVDAGAEGWFVGVSPGTYEVGAIRPLGAVVQRSRPVQVPGVHRICDGRCSRRPRPDDEPSTD